VRARAGLIGAQAGHPHGGAAERAVERRHFAYAAASLPRRDRVAIAVDPLLAHQRFERGRIGKSRADCCAVALLGFGPDFVCFGKQAAGIECHYVDRQSLREDSVCDCLVFDAEARREHDASANGVAQYAQSAEQIAIGE
jgi:hypothetical protein